jgi:GNAT superfamily N-acetyltransferase
LSKDYTIREYITGDEKGIVNLLEIVFKEWPHYDISCHPLDHWKWKYIDNPYGKKIIPIAIDGDLVVGSENGTTQLLKLWDQTYLSSQRTDLAVHPDYRRMGLYTKILEYKTQLYKDKGYSVTWGATTNPIVFDSELKWGRRTSIHKVLNYFYVNDVNKHYKYKKGKDTILKKIIMKYGKARVGLNTPKKNENDFDYTIEEITNFDNDYDIFWDQIKLSYDFIIDRSPKYMNWRYTDPRAGFYKIFVAKNEKKWLGYIVIRINRKKEYHEAFIADLIAPPNRRDVSALLLKEAKKYIDKENVNIIYCWAIQGGQLESVLIGEAYIKSQNHPLLIYQNINFASEWDNMYKIEANRMYLNYGDSDWV